MRARLTRAVVLLGLAVAMGAAANGNNATQAQPTPPQVILISPTLCFLGTDSFDWNGDTLVSGQDGVIALSACMAQLGDEGYMRSLVRVLSGDPDNPTPGEFQIIDREAQQLHDTDGALWAVAFVHDDTPMQFSADEGQFSFTGTSTMTCGPLPMPGYDFEEEDCDDDGDRGDGVVAVKLTAAGGVDRGLAELTVEQGGQLAISPFLVVGEPSDIQVTTAEPTITAGAPDCPEDSDFNEALPNPYQTLLAAKIVDDDGTELTGAIAIWESNDEAKADVASWGSFSQESTFGIRALAVLCGESVGGNVELTARISTGIEMGPALDPAATAASDTTQVFVASTDTDTDSDSLMDSEDNCPLLNNPDQFNSDDGRRPNGSQIPGAWASNPAQDPLGDACDSDNDNDSLPDSNESDASCPFRLNGDSDLDGAVDGYEMANVKDPCSEVSKPACSSSTDTDGDGFADCVEHMGYNTCAFAGDTVPGWSACVSPTDSDNDGCADWVEIVDVNGNRSADILDVLFVAKRAFSLIPVSDSDPVLDIDKNGAFTVLDALVAAKNSTLVKAHSPCASEG